MITVSITDSILLTSIIDRVKYLPLDLIFYSKLDLKSLIKN